MWPLSHKVCPPQLLLQVTLITYSCPLLPTYIKPFKKYWTACFYGAAGWASMRFKFLFFFCERFPEIYISILADSEMKSFKNPCLILPSLVTWSCKVVRLGSSLPSWQSIFYVMKCFKMCSRWLIAMRRRQASRHRRTNYGYVRTTWGSKTLEHIWGHNRTYRNVLISRTSQLTWHHLASCLAAFVTSMEFSEHRFFFPTIIMLTVIPALAFEGTAERRSLTGVKPCQTPLQGKHALHQGSTEFTGRQCANS